MATETVVSDHSSPSEEVEKEEVMKIDKECASDPPKESVETAKPGESATPCAEAEAKIEDKQIEPHLAEHAKDSNTDEEPKTVAVAQTEEKVEDKVAAVEPPPSVDGSITESTKEEVEDKPTVEEAPVVEALDKAIKSEPTIEPAEKQGESKELEEVEKFVDVPESLPVEKIEEKVEERPAEAENKSEATEAKHVVSESNPEAIEVKDVAVCEVESNPEEITQPAPVLEQAEQSEEVKKETLVEEVEGKICTDKVEDAELPKEEETSLSDVVKSEAPVSQAVEESIAKTCEGTELAEATKEFVEPEKIDEIAEVAEEKSVVAEELVKSEEKPTENSSTSVQTPEPVKEVAKDKGTSRDVELVADNGTEKCGETEVAEGAADVKLVEEKIKETVEATEANFDEEKKVNEPCETDVQNQETIKGSEDTKTTQDVPKDVPVKTQKQSIVKIVKQSLVKAKKAIIGKSNNTKTPVPEAKDDGNK